MPESILILKHGPTYYRLERMLPPPAFMERAWTLTKTDGTQYVVAVEHGREPVCDCKAAEFRKHDAPPCKHCRALVEWGLI